MRFNSHWGDSFWLMNLFCSHLHRCKSRLTVKKARIIKNHSSRMRTARFYDFGGSFPWIKNPLDRVYLDRDPTDKDPLLWTEIPSPP